MYGLVVDADEEALVNARTRSRSMMAWAVRVRPEVVVKGGGRGKMAGVGWGGVEAGVSAGVSGVLEVRAE